MANVQLSTNTLPDNEPSVAVNPENPKTIVAASHRYHVTDTIDFAVYRSTDGGDSFSTSILPVPTGFQLLGDPIVASGLGNIFLISGLSMVSRTIPPTTTSIIVYRSVDDGKTFSEPVLVSNPTIVTGIFDDKEDLHIDKSPASQFKGNAYVSYTRFTNNENNSQILFQRSIDGGKTWSAPISLTGVLNNPDLVQGSHIAVDRLGVVYVAWRETVGGITTFRVRRSDDGGVTFGTTITVSNISMIPSPLPVTGWAFRTPTFAFIDTDNSNGSFSGRVYAVWQDNRSGTAHILMSFSDNGGQAWSTPQQVDDSPAGTENFFPFIAVSPDTGTINVIYYTNRVSNTLLDVFLARSTNGGASFTDQRITDVSFNPNADTFFGNPSTFIGDYIGAAVIPQLQKTNKGIDGLIAVWTDTRTGNQDIFANVIPATKPEPPKPPKPPKPKPPKPPKPKPPKP
ncbi:hypothetical protein BTH38_29740 [Bacillus toyonensis]|uniref:sialidase family protein n=1 Tax=Bacillus toyonensis TaxID=155322 RepID=UPI000A19FA7C|nr:sialidase family protein [Bacillus toyonensis]OSM09561.1 hypothetical protein BTH38_29740 [Bacillus toyonensis]